MDTQEILFVIGEAKKARGNAFILDNKTPVGACIITEEKLVYPGCNVNSSISGLGLCAERCAIDHAILHGKYRYAALVTFADFYVYPCGACLQYLELFSQVNEKDIDIIMAKPDNTFLKSTLYELLPKGYRSSHYDKELAFYRTK